MAIQAFAQRGLHPELSDTFLSIPHRRHTVAPHFTGALSRASQPNLGHRPFSVCSQAFTVALVPGCGINSVKCPTHLLFNRGRCN
jgi:hypothetical protein